MNESGEGGKRMEEGYINIVKNPEDKYLNIWRLDEGNEKVVDIYQGELKSERFSFYNR